MDSKIIPEDIKRHCKLLLGEQIHINHDGCIAGIDNKRRLYIKRVPGGLVAYCHHCSQAGYYGLNSYPQENEDNNKDWESLRKWVLEGEQKEEVYRNGRTMEEIQGDFSNMSMSTPSYAWLNKYNVHITTPIEFNRCKILSDVSNGNPLFPIYNVVGDMCGMQIRNIHNGNPKYTTEYASDKEGSGSWYGKPTDSNLIITEDILSALKIMQWCECQHLALLRTTLSSYDERAIISMTNKKWIWVWLDDDDAGKASAEKLCQRLKYIRPDVHVMNICYKQPKECTEDDFKTQFDTTSKRIL